MGEFRYKLNAFEELENKHLNEYEDNMLDDQDDDNVMGDDQLLLDDLH